MSKLLSLPIYSAEEKSPLPGGNSGLTGAEMKEDKDAGNATRSEKHEKIRLLPKDYPLEQTLMKVLTEQIAGLYDRRQGIFHRQLEL